MKKGTELFVVSAGSSGRPVEDEKAPNALAAVLDIQRRNKENRDDYSPESVAIAERARELASAAYSRSKTYLNYRAKFIAVKVESVQTADKIQHYDRILELEQYCAANNIKVKQMRSHRILEIRDAD